ncbi:MAG: tRNA uridine-5-carboxymethylaminomethyl(34) synthesis GTPase MnmE [Elusimicrobia bacterium]|nr:tRNA uridine-5-carboxymethylaminomethyl(34) synthesis GTPase MnmE [Elusimicrobiota bacterium]
MAQGSFETSKTIARSEDTIVAVATPPGEGALGVVRLSGEEALSIAARFLVGPKPLSELPPRSVSLMRVRKGEHILDQVMVTLFQGPRSYTGEDAVEISTHGSPYILARLLELSQDSGARLALPGEFTFRAFLNGRMDLTQAEAVCGLIRAKTEWAHRTAQAHLQGALSQRLAEIRLHLMQLLAQVEVLLDHPEEEIPSLNREALCIQTDGVLREVETLINSFNVGRFLQDGLRIAIVGSPNVGKSSLLNALLGKERAIVTEFPGTTRDTLEEAAHLDGLAVIWIDTAGIRSHTLDPVEKEGMERTQRAIQSSDLILFVLDQSRDLQSADRSVMEMVLKVGKPVIAVLNKSDLPSMDLHLNGAPFSERVSVSAQKGQGLEELSQSIHRVVGIPGFLCAQEQPIWIASARHRDILLRVRQGIAEAMKLFQNSSQCFEDLVAVHLREALLALEEILGGNTTEDLLNTIFSNFCIGK